MEPVEPPPKRELHECCCVEFSPATEVPCGALVDADTPFCPDCEEHRSRPHKMGEGWGFSQQLITNQERK